MPEPVRPNPTRRAPAAGIVIGIIAFLMLVVLTVALRKAPSEAPGSPMAAGGNAPAANAPEPGPVTPAQPSGNPPSTKLPSPAPPPKEPSSGAGAAPTAAPNPNDLPPGHPEVPTSTGPQVSLQWLGHSCFYLYSPQGATAVTDPFDPKATGLAPPSTGAHLITVSSETPAHDNTAIVHGFPGEKQQVIRGKEARLKDLHVIPVATGGGRYAYVFETGGLRIAHLGDLRQPLGIDQVRAMGPIDILLLPVGGEGIPPRTAAALAQAIAPKIVIPMAYSTNTMSGPDAHLKPVDEFIAASKFAVTNKDLDTIMLGRPDLPPSTEIYTLKLRRE
jgi:L-ascorbate metabolism protein UlaG (beta-lactamase superfamily)